MTASAAEKGALPDYGPGFSIGTPFAALPPDGLYWSQKAAVSHSSVVNGQGNDVGIRTNLFLTTSTFLLATKYHFLGARYGAFIYNIKLYHANIQEPNGASGVVTSTSDLEIDPIDLSWSLGKGLFLGVSEGISPPTGSFVPSRLINIGHDRLN